MKRILASVILVIFIVSIFPVFAVHLKATSGDLSITFLEIGKNGVLSPTNPAIKLRISDGAGNFIPGVKITVKNPAYCPDFYWGWTTSESSDYYTIKITDWTSFAIREIFHFIFEKPGYNTKDVPQELIINCPRIEITDENGIFKCYDNYQLNSATIPLNTMIYDQFAAVFVSNVKYYVTCALKWNPYRVCYLVVDQGYNIVTDSETYNKSIYTYLLGPHLSHFPTTTLDNLESLSNQLRVIATLMYVTSETRDQTASVLGSVAGIYLGTFNFKIIEVEWAAATFRSYLVEYNGLDQFAFFSKLKVLSGAQNCLRNAADTFHSLKQNLASYSGVTRYEYSQVQNLYENWVQGSSLMLTGIDVIQETYPPKNTYTDTASGIIVGLISGISGLPLDTAKDLLEVDNLEGIFTNMYVKYVSLRQEFYGWIEQIQANSMTLLQEIRNSGQQKIIVDTPNANDYIISLCLTVSPQSIAASQQASIKIQVNYQGNALTGAQVSAEVTRPDSSKDPIQLSDNGIGQFTGTYSNTQLTGDYKVTSTAQKTGYVPSSASTIFSVSSASDSNTFFIRTYGYHFLPSTIYPYLLPEITASDGARYQVKLRGFVSPSPGHFGLMVDITKNAVVTNSYEYIEYNGYTKFYDDEKFLVYINRLGFSSQGDAWLVLWFGTQTSSSDARVIPNFQTVYMNEYIDYSIHTNSNNMHAICIFSKSPPSNNIARKWCSFPGLPLPSDNDYPVEERRDLESAQVLPNDFTMRVSPPSAIVEQPYPLCICMLNTGPSSQPYDGLLYPGYLVRNVYVNVVKPIPTMSTALGSWNPVVPLPAETTQTTVTVSETGGKVNLLSVSLQASDLVSGGNRISSSQIRFDKNIFDVPAGSQVQITATVTVPEDLPEGLYSGSITVSSSNAGSIVNFMSISVGSNTYNITVSVPGLPPSKSTDVFVDNVYSGSLAGGGSRIFVLYLNRSHCIMTNVTVPFSAGARYVAYDYSQTVSGPTPSMVNFSYCKEFWLNASVSPSYSGLITPGYVWVSEGSMINLTALPNGNYTFDHWALAGLNFGSANPYTITMNASQDLTAVFIPAQNQVELSNFNALFANSFVRVILPADTTPKPLGCFAAMQSDWTASGWVETRLAQFVEGLDTAGSFVNQSSGRPQGNSGDGILTFGGWGCNPVVKYVESGGTPSQDRAPIKSYVSGGTIYFQRSDGSSILGANLPSSVINYGEDMFVVEVFKDSSGRNIMIFYGFGWKGSYAAGKFFNSIYPSISSYSCGWIIVKWQDTNGDTLVNAPGGGDTYTEIARGP